MSDTLGERFVRALATKDAARMASLLRPDIDFRGMTPGNFWEASTAMDLIDRVLSSWFEENDHIDEVLWIESGGVGDRERIGYRLAVHNNDGPFVVELYAYYKVEDGAIAWMRVLCSGWQPVGPTSQDRAEPHP